MEFRLKRHRFVSLLPLWALEEVLRFGLKLVLLWWRYRQKSRPSWQEASLILLRDDLKPLGFAPGDTILEIDSAEFAIKLSRL